MQMHERWSILLCLLFCASSCLPSVCVCVCKPKCLKVLDTLHGRSQHVYWSKWIQGAGLVRGVNENSSWSVESIKLLSVRVWQLFCFPGVSELLCAPLEWRWWRLQVSLEALRSYEYKCEWRAADFTLDVFFNAPLLPLTDQFQLSIVTHGKYPEGRGIKVSVFTLHSGSSYRTGFTESSPASWLSCAEEKHWPGAVTLDPNRAEPQISVWIRYQITRVKYRRYFSEQWRSGSSVSSVSLFQPAVGNVYLFLLRTSRTPWATTTCHLRCEKLLTLRNSRWVWSVETRCENVPVNVDEESQTPGILENKAWWSTSLIRGRRHQSPTNRLIVEESLYYSGQHLSTVEFPHVSYVISSPLMDFICQENRVLDGDSGLSFLTAAAQSEAWNLLCDVSVRRLWTSVEHFGGKEEFGGLPSDQRYSDLRSTNKPPLGSDSLRILSCLPLNTVYNQLHV